MSGGVLVHGALHIWNPKARFLLSLESMCQILAWKQLESEMEKGGALKGSQV